MERRPCCYYGGDDDFAVEDTDEAEMSWTNEKERETTKLLSRQ